MFRQVLLLSLAFSSLTAVAAAATSTEPFELSAKTSADDFRKQAQELRREMGAGGRYAKLSQSDQTRIGEQLDHLQGIYDNRVAGSRISSKDQVQLVNSTEEINSTLTGNADDKMICEQMRMLGSNRTQKVCATSAEREEARRETRRSMGRNANVIDPRREDGRFGPPQRD